MSDLAILTPSSKPLAEVAMAEGAAVNPDDLSGVRRVVLAVKPAKWRTAAEDFAGRLKSDCVLVSVMAGVRSADLKTAFGKRVARVMPTTAVAVGQGVASVWSDNQTASREAHALFDPIAQTVDLPQEALIDVATAVSGSGAAYVYAFVQALAEAGEMQGLSAEQALALAQGTASGALAMMSAGGPGPADLIAEVASPGGTTEAGLNVLNRPGGLSELISDAVQAGLDRARELAR